MPFGTPYLLGSGTPAATAAIIVTVTTASLAGDIISVHIGQSSGSGETVASVTDSAGNSYGPITSQSTPQPAAFWQASTGTALPAGGTVTVTFTGAASTKLIAVTGVPGGALLDQVNPAGGTSATPSVSTPAAMAAVPEIALATFCSANGGGSPALAAGWTSLALVHTGTTPYLQVAWKKTVSQAVITASETITSAAWGALITTIVPATLPPPQIPVFPAGFGPLPADFNNWVQATLGFCTAGLLLRAEQQAGGGQAITASTFTSITYDTVLEDPYQGWDPVNHKYVVPYTGWYEITMGYSIVSASATIEAVPIISGTTRYELSELTCVSNTLGGAGASLVVPLIGGIDSVRGQAWSSANVTTDTTAAGRFPWLEVTYISQ